MPHLGTLGIELCQIGRFAAVLGVEKNLALIDLARRPFDQTHDRLGCDALAATALSDQSERLLSPQRKIDTAHCAYSPLLQIERGVQILDVEDGVVNGGVGCTVGYDLCLYWGL